MNGKKCQHGANMIPQKAEICSQSSNMHWSIKLLIGLFVVLVIVEIFGTGCNSSSVSQSSPVQKTAADDEEPAVLPSITIFLAEHKEFGSPTMVQSIPDWARGERQRVQFTTGRNLLFYIEEGSVVTVYEDTAMAGRKKIWGSGSPETSEYAKNVSKSGEGKIPGYTVISAINLIAGGKHADVLIPSLSRNTPHATRSKVAFAILKKEQLRSLSMYSTRDAYKADYSSSFAAQHPNASNERLGSISMSTGEFTD